MKSILSEGGAPNSASESFRLSESNGRFLAIDVSKSESVGLDINNNKKKKINGSKPHAEGACASGTSGSACSNTPTELMTATALLWGRAPTMDASMTTSLLSSSPSSTNSSPKNGTTNSSSPASNAAAALLVGMSMRNVRGGNTPIELTDSIRSDSKTNVTEVIADTNPHGEEGPLDVEAEWRRIRLGIAQEALESALSTENNPGNAEECVDHLDLPKGVTRRPSGAWQAQIYFAGKTRYIGVWEKAYQAANAYNRAKEALAEIKQAQKKTYCKRKRRTINSPTIEVRESLMMATPRRNSDPALPPSITWPSSASSSSTASSSGLRSPSGAGPLKKRGGLDIQDRPQAQPLPTPTENPQPHGIIPPPRGHPYSAFSQHFQHQQELAMSAVLNGHVQPRGSLAHPALQLLSLRPQPAALWMQHARPPPFHETQHYRHPSPHHYSYARPMPPHNAGANRNGAIIAKQTAKALNSAVHPSAPLMASNGKMEPAKTKESKTPSSHRKKNNKLRKSDDNEPTARQAENLKWKTTRAEVLANFFASKNVNGDNPDTKKTFDKDVLRGITVRPSGKFQAQLYFGGRSRYIGVFNSEFDAASAYEMIRSRLKDDSKSVPHNLHKQNHKSEESQPKSQPSAAVSDERDGKEGKNTKATAQTVGAKTTTLMRSITPSPTPRGNNRGKQTKVVSQA